MMLPQLLQAPGCLCHPIGITMQHAPYGLLVARIMQRWLSNRVPLRIVTHHVSLLTVQVLHADPVPDGAQIVSQVEGACWLHTREHPLPARHTHMPEHACNDPPSCQASSTCQGQSACEADGFSRAISGVAPSMLRYLRGAAGCWGSLALEGCLSVSGTLAAVAQMLRLLQCRAAQAPFVWKADVLQPLAPDALDALSPAGSEALWLRSCELRNIKQEQCAAFAAAIALASTASGVLARGVPSEALLRPLMSLYVSGN